MIVGGSPGRCLFPPRSDQRKVERARSTVRARAAGWEVASEYAYAILFGDLFPSVSRSDIFSLRLRVPFTFYERSSRPFLSANDAAPRGIKGNKRRGKGGGGGEPNEIPLSVRPAATPQLASETMSRETDARAVRAGSPLRFLGDAVLQSMRSRARIASVLYE